MNVYRYISIKNGECMVLDIVFGGSKRLHSKMFVKLLVHKCNSCCVCVHKSPVSFFFSLVFLNTLHPVMFISLILVVKLSSSCVSWVEQASRCHRAFPRHSCFHPPVIFDMNFALSSVASELTHGLAVLS